MNLLTISDSQKRLLLCAGAFLLLVIWAIFWPYSGDGDSMLHYWNLRVSWLDPQFALTSWARTGFVLLMIWAAQFGVLSAKIFASFLSVITMWQTMKFADDLQFRNAHLAGLFFILQPLVFALSNDVMTEVPMALGVVIALRLWLTKRWITSCIVVSFLPFLRPEGFFIAPIWGLFLLALPYNAEHPTFLKRIQIGAFLATGFLVFLPACFFITGDFLYYIHAWSWSENSAQRGAFFHHFYQWFNYCGALLFPLFIAGIYPSLKKRMALPWAIWLVVILTHSYFFWRAMFGSVGFMRIMVCSASVTAIICLYGWNQISEWINAERFSPRLRQAFTCLVIFIGVGIVLVKYALDPTHHRWVLAREAADFVKSNQLLDEAKNYFISDTMTMGELNVPAEHVLDTVAQNLQRGPLVALTMNREKNLEKLRSLPVGTIGVWDDELGKYWHQIELDEFPKLGYTILYRTSQQTPNGQHKIYRAIFNRYMNGYAQEVIVVRKNGELKPPQDVMTQLRSLN
jgi:hypothetical protein